MQVMKMNNFRIGLAARALAVIAVAATTRLAPAGACAALPEEGRVSVVEEAAVIVWDAKNKTEHFIRRATFDAKGKSIGFIVPSPSVPQLAAADANVFSQLEDTIRPRVEHQNYTTYPVQSLLFHNTPDSAEVDTNRATKSAAAPKGRSGPKAVSVDVIRKQRVGGYEATTLKANDAGALNRWLRRNGYQSSAAFEKWLGVYVDKGWVVTAFKVPKGNSDTSQFTSQLVRMSFKSPRPFYPYREPQEGSSNAAPKRPRSLRVYFMAPSRVAPAPGTFATLAYWPGETKWADNANKSLFNSASQRSQVAGQLKISPATLQQTPWLTVFEDNASPRPGTEDVYFQNAANIPFIPPPTIVRNTVQRPVYLEPLLLLLFGTVAVPVFVLRKRNRRASGRSVAYQEND